MSTLGIGTLAYKLAGLFVTVRSLPLLVDLVIRDYDQPEALVGQVLLVALGVLLWVSASWLAVRTFPATSNESRRKISGQSELFEIGVRLTGLWLIAAKGIPNALFTIVNNTAIEWDFGSPNTMFTWWQVVPDAIVITVGLLLLVAPGVIVRRVSV